jgi:hypothetical protein
MKLPSFKQMGEEFRRICARFPLVVIDAVAGTIAALILIEQEGAEQSMGLVRILMSAVLGFPLLLGLALSAEKKEWSRALRILGQGTGLLLLTVYGASLPASFDGAPSFHMARFLMLCVAFLLFLAVAPFTGSKAQNGFWHYAKALVTRAATVVFFAGVLQAGLSLALVALDQLFGIDIPGKRYGELWTMIAGLFSTLFFLAGMPENLATLEQECDYPKGLKIFAQYILSTVLLVYLFILYAYLAKIVFAWSWPKGWVSTLILGFSATGLVALLLIWPIRNQEENRWSRLVWRSFFFVLIPMVIMLPLAVWRRISEYGITESRYLAIAVSLYLALLVVYFTISRVKNIKFIPGLLGLFALLACFGPWSAFSISEASQKNRLTALLTENSILRDGRIQKAAASLPNETALQISSIVAYLHEMHGYEGIQSWFQEKLVKESKGRMVPLRPEEVTGLMGIEYLRGVPPGFGTEHSLTARGESILDIAGYEKMIIWQFIGEGDQKVVLGESGLFCRASEDMSRLVLVYSRSDGSEESVHFDLLPLVNELYAVYGRTNPQDIPLERMALTADGAHLKAKLYLRHIRVEEKEEGLKLLKYHIDLIYTLRE